MENKHGRCLVCDEPMPGKDNARYDPKTGITWFYLCETCKIVLNNKAKRNPATSFG